MRHAFDLTSLVSIRVCLGCLATKLIVLYTLYILYIYHSFWKLKFRQSSWVFIACRSMIWSPLSPFPPQAHHGAVPLEVFLSISGVIQDQLEGSKVEKKIVIICYNQNFSALLGVGIYPYNYWPFTYALGNGPPTVSHPEFEPAPFGSWVRHAVHWLNDMENRAIRYSSRYSRTLLLHKKGKMSTSSIPKEMLYRQKKH